MLAGMYRAWRLLDEEDDLRMAILTGQGDVFCAGADFKSMGAGEMDEEFMKLMSEIPDIHWQALLRHNRPMQPIVAAGDGSAVAGGTETLLGTDIRDAAEDAVFEITEARKIAATICENAPRSVRALVRMLREVGESSGEALAKELEVGSPIFGTRDAREGMKAFAEKRKPIDKDG